jgi:hypothetical protein
MRRFIPAIFLLAASLAAHAAMAESLHFEPGLPGWSAVAFPGIAPARFAALGEDTLAVSTDSGAGMLWHPLAGAARQPSTARWRWRVDEGVAATDLTKRGADDRSLGVYFVFGERRASPGGAMDLLASPSVTALVYVFGGDRPRGSVVPSPHMGARGKFIVLRPAATAKQIWFDEKVELAADYARAFGRAMPALIGVAISSDSDDTRARNRASLQGLVTGE